MKRWLFMSVILLLSVRTLMAQGIQFVEDKPWQEVLKMAAEQNKLIFLDCYTTWCGPCKAMAKDVFPLAEVGNYMNPRFINTKLDMEKGDGIEVNKKYKKYIPGYPTYLLINGKGEVVHQVAGYNAADKFIAKIGDGLKQRSWVIYSQQYDKGQRDWNFIWTYLVTLEDAFQQNKVKEVTAAVLPSLTISAITNDSMAYKVFRKYWTDPETPLFNAFYANAAVFRKHRDPERDVNEWAGRMYKRAVDAYVQSSINSPATYDTIKANKLIDDLRGCNAVSRENLTTLMVLSKAIVKKDDNNFLRLAEAAREFGLLKYDLKSLGTWSRQLAEKTTDKAKLKRYQVIAQFRENEQFVTAEEVRNCAFILNKMGDKAKAQAYYKKVDEIEAKLKASYDAFIKGK